LFVALLDAAHAQRPEVVYVPTPHETVQRMLTLARVGASDYVIDLGSGDGRIPIAAGRNGARALGIELDAELIRQSTADAKTFGVGNRVTFRQEDLFKTPLDEATVITLYLLPEMNVRLRPRILALKPGTRVVAHQFAMGDWKADVIDDDGGRIFLWYVPAQTAGRWQVAYGAQRFTIDLQQQYQEISGTATVAGMTRPLREAKLRGTEIEFVADVGGKPLRFRGAVAGNAMQAASGGFGFDLAANWQAVRE
jgi:hypothetical protein